MRSSTASTAPGRAAAKTGWAPQFPTLWEGERLVAAAPLYVKSHSYGEYVFDWAWAEAYERHGIDYYPKLLCAVPFTPATGARLLAQDAAARQRLAAALLGLARSSPVSSLHVLFPTAEDAVELRGLGLLERSSVQFHWRNAGYASFAEFLEALSRDKRKKIRQERRRVAEAGVVLKRLTGREARAADWDFFTACYRRTYREHRSTPYLDRAFFGMIAERMPDHLLLVIAERDGRPIAAALDVFGAGVAVRALLGQHGARSRPAFRGLLLPGDRVLHRARHRALRGRGAGRAQARARLPRRDHALLPLARASGVQPRVDEFVGREGEGIAAYVDEMNERSPFRR
jgi:predicted N-acyltransferase